jgi:hypothetical protein
MPLMAPTKPATIDMRRRSSNDIADSSNDTDQQQDRRERPAQHDLGKAKLERKSWHHSHDGPKR